MICIEVVSGIAKKDDLIALFALLAVSLIGSHLSQQARRRAQEAVILAQERNEAVSGGGMANTTEDDEPGSELPE